MSIRPYARPFDPTASALKNLVVNEIRPLGEDSKYVFIPSMVSFYADTLVVTTNGRLLTRNVEYQTLILYPEATEVTGKEVCVAIRINDRDLTQVEITYQAVGGKYEKLIEVLRSIKENAGGDLISPIYYKDIVNKPEKFNPSAHMHPMWDFAGWEVLVNQLNDIRTALTIRDKQNYRDIYDYYYSKETEFNTWLKQRLSEVENKMMTAALRMNYPDGMLVAARNPVPAEKPLQGIWSRVGPTLLFGVGEDVDLGRTWEVSASLVFPQPDNILLDDDDVPIVRDDKNWIYLDNEHEAIPRSVTEEYWEEIDELFDNLQVLLYRKIGTNIEFKAEALVNVPELHEDQVALFTLNTIGYPVGTTVPYQITGVNQSNITVPLLGEVTINTSGVATLAVKLIAGSPRTGNNFMDVEFMIMGGLSIGCKYALQSNIIQTIESRFTATRNNDDVLTNTVVGDQFYIRLFHREVAGTAVTIKHPIVAGLEVMINGVVSNGVTTVNIAAGTDLTFIPVIVRNVGGDDLASVPNFTAEITTSRGVVAQSGSIRIDAYELYAEWIDPTLNKIVTQGRFNRPYRLRLSHNSRQVNRVAVVISHLPTQAVLDPAGTDYIYFDTFGYGGTANYELIIANSEHDGHLRYTVRHPQIANKQYVFTLPIVREQ